MKRECGLCGTIVPSGSNVCPKCGNTFSEKYFDDDYEEVTIVNNPSWGAIKFDFSNYSGNVEDELKRIRILWETYERDPTIQLGLFSGQFFLVAPSPQDVKVYGPKAVADALAKDLSLAIADGLRITYQRMPLDEIHRLQIEHLSRLASVKPI